ncbi:hypothetical protein FB451DRAFT_1373842 [Mycena latifolia]|nr:hypothetical protein FB451DRAFT_1373842 [Mycena latifolia]
MDAPNRDIRSKRKVERSGTARPRTRIDRHEFGRKEGQNRQANIPIQNGALARGRFEPNCGPAESSVPFHSACKLEWRANSNAKANANQPVSDSELASCKPARRAAEELELWSLRTSAGAHRHHDACCSVLLLYDQPHPTARISPAADALAPCAPYAVEQGTYCAPYAVEGDRTLLAYTISGSKRAVESPSTDEMQRRRRSDAVHCCQWDVMNAGGLACSAPQKLTINALAPMRSARPVRPSHEQFNSLSSVTTTPSQQRPRQLPTAVKHSLIFERYQRLARSPGSPGKPLTVVVFRRDAMLGRVPTQPQEQPQKSSHRNDSLRTPGVVRKPARACTGGVGCRREESAQHQRIDQLNREAYLLNIILTLSWY